MKTLSLIALAALFVFSAAVALAADSAPVVNLTFDKPDTFQDWQFEFGGVEHTEAFSKDDAGGKKDSGSLEVIMKFPAKDGEHKGAYTYTFPEPLDATKLEKLELDLKVVNGSASDSQGDNGYYTLAFRNDAGDWDEKFQDSIRVSDGWRHVSEQIDSDTKSLKSITFQLWGGPDQNISGPVTLRLDNFKLIPKASAAKGAAAK
jgi:hypothetical protein